MAQCNQTRATIKNKLQTPLVIRDILQSKSETEDDALYALHEILSDQDAENALLSAAFIMQEITAFQTVATNDLAFLHLECDRIIERYCTREDLSHENPKLWNDSHPDMIDEIAEDIEGFLDLTALCQLSFEITAPRIAQILNIITTQLQSALLIIDEVINMTACKKPVINMTYTDNVIQFPVSH